jgi:hypothetical protein
MERPHRNNIVFSAARNPEAIIAALAAFCLVYFSAPSIGLSPDSISYASAARSLYTSGRPLEFDGEWLVDFPLGYPALLSLILFITRLDPFQFGLVLNGLLFGILVFICLREGKKNGFPLLLRCGYGLCLLFSAALLQVYGMLWSETLFILCVALFFVACGRYGRTHGAGALWAMAGATALACVTRYIGVTLMGMGILLLLTDRLLSRRKRGLHLLWYGSVSCSLLLVNLVWNRLNNANMAGDRLVNLVPFREHVQRFGEALLRWLPFYTGSPGGLSPGPSAVLSTACAIVFVGGSIGGAGWLLWRKRSLYSWAALGVLFTAGYSVLILIMATLTAFQPLDSRLLSPLWFPALGAVAGGIRLLWRRWGVGRSAGAARIQFAIKSLILVPLIILILPGLIREYGYVRYPDEVYQDHIRYDFNQYRGSPTLRFVNTHPGLFRSGKPVYSNAGEVLYVLGNLSSAYLPQLSSAEEMQDFNGDTAWLVWLNTVHAYPGDYLSALKKASALSPLYSFPDGIIFSTLPPGPAGPSTAH